MKRSDGTANTTKPFEPASLIVGFDVRWHICHDDESSVVLDLFSDGLCRQAECRLIRI